MRIQPIASPNSQQQSTSNATDSRSRAINAFNQSQETPVANPSQVSPEEMSAVTAPQAPERQNTIVQEGDNTQEVAETTEAPLAAAEKTQEDSTVSRQYAQLARQEKAIRARAQAVKEREAALAAREAGLSTKAAAPQDFSGYISKDSLKQNYMTHLAEAGVSYDDIVEKVISQQTPSDPRVEAALSKAEQRIAQLEAKIEESAKGQQTAQQAQYQAAVKQITNDVKHLVFTDPAYEAIKATNSVNDVVELITKTFEKDGILLTNEEAAQQVEDYLTEESLKLAKLAKIQKRLQTVAPNATSTAAKQPPASTKQSQPMKTLTNATSSTRKLTAKERAILAFKGELKD